MDWIQGVGVDVVCSYRAPLGSARDVKRILAGFLSSIGETPGRCVYVTINAVSRLVGFFPPNSPAAVPSMLLVAVFTRVPLQNKFTVLLELVLFLRRR